MEIKTEIKTVTKEYIKEKYIADDGTEFDRQYECEDYERKCKLSSVIKSAEELRLKQYDNVLPISKDGLVNENNTFCWYELKNEEDYIALVKACGDNVTKPMQYPEIVCIETCGYKEYMDDAYSYRLSDLKTITEDFWKQFGYKVKIERGF